MIKYNEIISLGSNCCPGLYLISLILVYLKDILLHYDTNSKKLHV